MVASVTVARDDEVASWVKPSEVAGHDLEKKGKIPIGNSEQNVGRVRYPRAWTRTTCVPRNY